MPSRCSSVGTVEMTVRSNRLPLALVVGEEERAIPPNRPAKDAPELVPPKLRLDWIGATQSSCARSAPRAGRTRTPCHETSLLPAFVVRLITPPLNRPNSAGGLLLSILNSWMASMFGKNATCPGSGCSTEMPSNRYSLVRGRPPLMRGSDEPGGRATPGTRLASVMKLRPFSGRPTTFCWSTTCPSPDVWPRRSGASAMTVMASSGAPTFSSTSSRTVSPVAMATPARTSGRNPANSTRTAWVPGASAGTV